MRKCFMYIDDTLWVFKEIARALPDSIYDHPFMAMLKKAHDLYGAKIQLNVFYRNSFFYGSTEEFSLKDMPDKYKAQWTEASDWLRFGFHSREEFPDYPYLNAKYCDVLKDINDIKSEIARFACERSFALGTIPHWNAMSLEGCRALRDAGIKIVHSTCGPVSEYNGDPNSIPYGHDWRLLHNRQPETKCFGRGDRNVAIAHSLCAHNHVDDFPANAKIKTTETYVDEKTGLKMKALKNGIILNHYALAELPQAYEKLIGDEFITTGNHEQYFYPYYFNYQKEYADKLLKAAQILSENNYEFIFFEEL